MSDTADTADTAVLLTRVPGELQLYFASVIQQPNEKAEISLITAHQLTQEIKYIALRQNRLVYLVGKLVEVEPFNVESILSSHG